ncbi:MAG: HNH endonuclease [Pseudomonadota bacterium]
MNKSPPPAAVAKSSLVTRSVVPTTNDYLEFKPYLRYDFFHSCAYCTMSEAEARAIRFTIDHYEPRNARSDLVNEYSNLMYSCDECNLRKGDRSPPPSARLEGYRFFRPDQDEHADHFSASGIRINPRTNLGEYTVEALDLNRAALRKLRELRKRLVECEQTVIQGVLALRSIHIDRLPSSVKGQVNGAIARAQGVAAELATEIDSILRSYAKSDLIDVDPDSETRAKERSKKLKDMASLHPGSWRAPRAPRKK